MMRAHANEPSKPAQKCYVRMPGTLVDYVYDVVAASDFMAPRPTTLSQHTDPKGTRPLPTEAHKGKT